MTERAQALEDAIEKARQGLIGFAAEIHDGRVPVVGAVRDHLVLNLGLIASFLTDALLAVPPPPPVGSPTTEQMNQWLSAMETGATHDQRRLAWNNLRDHFNPLKSTPVEPAGASEPPSEDFTAPLPPRPPAVVKPQRYDLVRYGVTWEGQDNQPLLTPMPDGYWTPWHLAVEAPTVEPEPCVWRMAELPSRLVPGCHDGQRYDLSWALTQADCPNCGSPLKVER